MEKDPYRYFRIEGRELADELGKHVLALEKEVSGERIALLLRLAHTLKGAARVVKLNDVADWAHAIEDTLAPWRDGQAGGTPPVEALLALVDRVSRRVAGLSTPKAATPVVDEPVHAPRAEPGELDALLAELGEVGARLAGLRGCQDRVDRLRGLAEHVGGGHAEALREELAGLARELGAGLEQADRELTQVRESAERLRLVPAQVMFAALERTARDAAVALGRPAAFVGRGGDVRLDGGVLTQVQRALVQAVRNAVAHGIEPGPARAAAGKPPTGQIVVEASRSGHQLIFTCRDDGAGVDVEAVRARAVARGASAGATRAELLDLLLAGGISTAPRLSELAGRGVGLDLVRETARQLGGQASLSSERGRGTTLELRLPLSLSSLDALVVEADGRRAAIPLDRVRRTLRVDSDRLVHTGDGLAVLVDGQLVPFAPLARVLGGRDPAPARCTAALVESDGACVALGVDRLVASENVVVRPLPPMTPAAPVIAGATLDVAGTPRLVLDAGALVAAVRQSAAQTRRAARPSRPPILVIDDSLTTRMLEQSILESAGFEVDVAVHAEEGLAKARTRRYGLFLVDVEMPGMDGFTFIATAKADPALRDVPAILVTSRTAPEDRARGAAVGAHDYVAKSEFDQRRLLERIRELVGTGAA